MIKQIDYKPSIALYESLRELPFSALLDSSLASEQARYSIIAADPFLILKNRGNVNFLIENNSEKKIIGNTFDLLKDIFSKYSHQDTTEGFLNSGCAIGFFGYDLNTQLENLASFEVDDLNISDCIMCFYDVIFIVDEITQETKIVSTGLPFKGSKVLPKAKNRLKYFIDLINAKPEKAVIDHAFIESKQIKSNFTKRKYIDSIKKAISYIKEGDIYQVNLSQRFSMEIRETDAFSIYKKLRELSPAPFSAYFDSDEFTLLSSSPERFLKVRGKEVETKPIKGTRPRSNNLDEDKRLADELLGSEKDRAENVMIVDVLRNDLGRVCMPGSVKTSSLFDLEKYKTVMHLVSTVKGQLEKNMDIFDLLKASFPGGSITGAPKIRAMEIINELEPTKRGPYTGCFGYIGFDGSVDLNILIRTIIIKKNLAYFQVGGGIVFDSEPEKEYQETLDKGIALFKALGYNGRLING